MKRERGVIERNLLQSSGQSTMRLPLLVANPSASSVEQSTTSSSVATQHFCYPSKE